MDEMQRKPWRCPIFRAGLHTVPTCLGLETKRKPMLTEILVALQRTECSGKLGGLAAFPSEPEMPV
jgi:hypothetical protein